MNDVPADPDRATQLRNKVVDQLRDEGWIASPEVEKVMRDVPRHLFTPADTPLEQVYDPYSAVITKTDEYGVQLSSVSAPQIQALMLEQATLRPGMNVLEVGSGGLNALYLFKLVGPGGSVTTVDIDPEVTGRTERLLGEMGYGQIRVVTADAAEPIPGLGQVDVILVTAGAWDIPPAWLDQLKPGGRLVVPLRMRGLTRSVAFTRVGHHLESESAKICGFVPMQGSTEHHEKLLLVNGTEEIALRFDDGLPSEPGKLDNAVTTPRHELWTGVTVGLRELLDTLQMQLAISLPGFCTMAVDEDLDTGLVAPVNKRHALAAVEDDTFAYLVTRRTQDNKHVEYGVHALGPNAEQFARKIADVLRDWEATRRGGPGPDIRVYPAGTPDDQISGDRVIDKVHSRISLSWPAAQASASRVHQAPPVTQGGST
ncbi:methyltransferase, FxLD system [Streptomyces sp. NPDC091292]|uniref:methyltransferase, FxLD system n=1 Tax=Streptomyces sp. NPDC091292 TaxID=3365991 RepID=UPI0037F1C032